MKAHFLTDRGIVRDHNEDCGGIYYNLSQQFLAVIADGMGGHQAGDVASQTAVKQIQKEWEQTKMFSSAHEAEQWLETQLIKINHKILEKAAHNNDYQGMGTTIVVVIGIEKELTVAHIGDSRCYLQQDSKISQITEDHSLVNELIRSGQMTEEDAVHYPRKNVVLKALGTEENIAPDIQSLSWKQGDKILLCSDGLSDKVDSKELEEFLNQNEKINIIAQSLVELANDRGGEDNISLIIIQMGSKKQGGGDEC